MNAVVNWTKALKSDGTPLGGVPSLFGTSLQVPTHTRTLCGCNLVTRHVIVDDRRARPTMSLLHLCPLPMPCQGPRPFCAGVR